MLMTYTLTIATQQKGSPISRGYATRLRRDNQIKGLLKSPLYIIILYYYIYTNIITPVGVIIILYYIIYYRVPIRDSIYKYIYIYILLINIGTP